MVLAGVVFLLRLGRRGGGGGGGGRGGFSGVGSLSGGGGALAEEAVKRAPVDGGRCGVGRVEASEGVSIWKSALGSGEGSGAVVGFGASSGFSVECESETVEG
ncbi:hypothetical protein CHLRE_04g217985v5 [Chlamydomonas reinhardtii]|uniref:Uncharacterized protein n=1 Tax=Chlamydomonas reinhardtii TaxID=3055 RepID=A0A2K3DTM2_CHLRE|nr:uncharacterized protein CHLRE_10g445201v5 [Chlamydomonas reinhardtii]XP_042920262.1 uncharacterized protein CHLRE_10g445201v5 [Chlamydomonas reinhardtii]XP_042920263.1 uncharacterized protein CHLRE_10g445201v5 [Chlamydomonas reinhardtii]XP_042925077.1 uncharacterized protein CHLRE_04g217985v5 [Chlamydomonas reinhardtii]XP_042925078.1 uncharacterized protein CHLRE_04g217985v5 [Chlamydomonas reinhardtii]PNW77635.1 hypothetical protein CHLRE_10g445201v5 [Chlamydomonas reinhardtii]PNW77636.1 h